MKIGETRSHASLFLLQPLEAAVQGHQRTSRTIPIVGLGFGSRQRHAHDVHTAIQEGPTVLFVKETAVGGEST